MYQEIFNKQRKLFLSKVTYEYEFRKSMLLKLKKMIKDNINKFEEALYKDLGKAKTESYMCEIGLVLDKISYALKNLKSFMKPTKVSSSLVNFPSSSYIIKDPYGVCLIMAPWNYPLLLSIEPLIGAISGGNTAFLKLSEYSVHTSTLIKKLIKSNFEENYIAVFDGGVDDTTNILKLPFDFIFFTGSEKVGKIVMQAASLHLTPVCLELGGKSPAIVTKNANVKLAAKRIIFGKIINAGQTCVAPDFIYVDEDVKNELIEHLIINIKEMLGDCILDNNDYPKIISKRHLDRLISLIDKNKVIFGGQNNIEKLEITLIDNASFEDKIMQEEIFGPILPIISYKDLNEVKLKLDQLPSPLALYLFSNDKTEIDYFTKYIRFGGGCINDTINHLVGTNMPFGGVGSSGMGNYHGKYTFNTFTREKGILNKSNFLDIKLRYHPYSDKKEKLIKKILK